MRKLTFSIVLLLLVVIVINLSTISAADSLKDFHKQKDDAHEVAELLRSKGYSEDNPVIKAASDWWFKTHEDQMSMYPVATEVWQLLTEAGLSSYVTAAIIGNMMAECGGQTLALIPDLYCGQYYGLCMWDVNFTPQVDGLDVSGQIKVLLETLESNISIGGGDYNYFLQIKDVRVAARYFEKYYERSAGWSEQRANNAEVAFKWFCG